MIIFPFHIAGVSRAQGAWTWTGTGEEGSWREENPTWTCGATHTCKIWWNGVWNIEHCNYLEAYVVAQWNRPIKQSILTDTCIINVYSVTMKSAEYRSNHCILYCDPKAKLQSVFVWVFLKKNDHVIKIFRFDCMILSKEYHLTCHYFQASSSASYHSTCIYVRSLNIESVLQQVIAWTNAGLILRPHVTGNTKSQWIKSLWPKLLTFHALLFQARGSISQDELNPAEKQTLTGEEEQQKITEYEMAFKRIKEATGVSDTQVCETFIFSWNHLNRECHLNSHRWRYYPGTLFSSQVSATHLKIGHL